MKRALFGADCYAYALLASGFGTHLVVEADLGLYDYCALVPVVQGAGGVITDWQGLPLTLQSHKAGASKGRVVTVSMSGAWSQYSSCPVDTIAAEADVAVDRGLRGVAPGAEVGVAGIIQTTMVTRMNVLMVMEIIMTTSAPQRVRLPQMPRLPLPLP